MDCKGLTGAFFVRVHYKGLRSSRGLGLEVCSGGWKSGPLTPVEFPVIRPGSRNCGTIPQPRPGRTRRAGGGKPDWWDKPAATVRRLQAAAKVAEWHAQGSPDRATPFGTQKTRPATPTPVSGVQKPDRDAQNASRDPDRDAKTAPRTDIRGTQNVLCDSWYRNVADSVARSARFFLVRKPELNSAPKESQPKIR